MPPLPLRAAPHRATAQMHIYMCARPEADFFILRLYLVRLLPPLPTPPPSSEYVTGPQYNFTKGVPKLNVNFPNLTAETSYTNVRLIYVAIWKKTLDEGIRGEVEDTRGFPISVESSSTDLPVVSTLDFPISRSRP